MARLSAASRLSSTTRIALWAEGMLPSPAPVMGQEFPSPRVGQVCRCRLVMRPADARERVIDPRIAVERDRWIALQRLLDGLLSGGRNELILFRHVQGERLLDVLCLADQIP